MVKPDRCPTCHRLKKRSDPANRRYWLVIHMISDKLRPEGVQHSPDIWHLYFKQRFLGADDMTLPNKKVVSIPKSTAELPTDEFADYAMKVEQFAAERNIYLDEIPA